MKKIKKMKEKDFEMEQDLFAISKANRRGMIIFLAVMLALWCVPIYSLLKDSLKVHGLENYWYVLTNEVNGVPFYQYFINSRGIWNDSAESWKIQCSPCVDFHSKYSDIYLCTEIYCKWNYFRCGKRINTKGLIL